MIHSPATEMPRAAASKMFWNAARHIFRLREAEK
jgi:hypothetical protein